MTKTGKLNKRELETLNKAWQILSTWSERAEDDADTDEYLYEVAMNAVCGLCEFVNNYDTEGK